MIADHLTGIEQFDADLWKIADDLRANSNLASNEYFMPIMGLLFLRQATNRYYEALAAIEADKAAGKMPDRPLVEADFTPPPRTDAAGGGPLRRDPRDAEGRQAWCGADRRHGSGRDSTSRRSRASCRRTTSASRTTCSKA